MSVPCKYCRAYEEDERIVWLMKGLDELVCFKNRPAHFGVFKKVYSLTYMSNGVRLNVSNVIRQ